MKADTPAQSPFLPGTSVQFAWDSTSLGYLKTCPRLYQYTMIEGWSNDSQSPHLTFGIEYHRALQEYDIARATDTPHDGAVQVVIRALLERTYIRSETYTGPWVSDHKYKNRENLVRTVCWYLDQFRNDPAKTLILEGGKPAVELSFRFELDWGPKAGLQPYLLSGHLDRVVEFNNELFVMDRKTSTTTPSAHYFAQFEPSNQMTLYTLASQIILNSPVKGVIIDAAQVLVDSSRFTRGFTYRTKTQLAEWMEDLKHWFSLAESYATAGYWPQNDTACDKFGGCRFREVCSKAPQVREQFLKARFTKLEPDMRWNPLRSRG